MMVAATLRHQLHKEITIDIKKLFIIHQLKFTDGGNVGLGPDSGYFLSRP